MDPALIPVFSGIGGIIVGGLLGPLGARWIDKQAGREHRQAIAGALRAEIAAILDITDRNEYEGVYRGWVSCWKRGESAMPRISGVEEAYEKGDPVFHAHLTKLGLLPTEIAAKIVAFYAGVNCLRCDLVNISKGHFPPKACIEIVEGDLIYLAEIKSIGHDLLLTLPKVR